MPDADPAIPRYSSLPFPRYRYLPGRGPHPTRDPAGHSFGAPELAIASFRAEDWKSCGPYLYAVDLFNHGYWWEAHEALEGVWKAAGRSSETGLFLQGLIQIAAGAIKRAVDAPGAAASLATLGVAKLRGQSGVFLGIEISSFSGAVEAFLSTGVPQPPRIRLVGL